MTWWTKLSQRAGQTRRDAVWRFAHWCWREFQRAGRVTAGTPAGRAFRAFGPGSIMAFPPGSVFGEGAIEIGADTLIGQQVSLTAGMLPGQDLGQWTVLRIGDRCVIGRGSHVIAHESVKIIASRVVYVIDDDFRRRVALAVCCATGDSQMREVSQSACRPGLVLEYF